MKNETGIPRGQDDDFMDERTREGGTTNTRCKSAIINDLNEMKDIFQPGTLFNRTFSFTCLQPRWCITSQTASSRHISLRLQLFH